MSNIVIYILSFFDKLYQKKIINKLKQIFNNNLDVVFDVGAHKGEFVKLITKNFITNKIYSFEPSEKSFTILKNNISDKKINSNQIFLNNFGLGMINEKKKI
jgi:tRNA G46 methylase TrmB